MISFTEFKKNGLVRGEGEASRGYKCIECVDSKHDVFIETFFRHKKTIIVNPLLLFFFSGFSFGHWDEGG